MTWSPFGRAGLPLSLEDLLQLGFVILRTRKQRYQGSEPEGYTVTDRRGDSGIVRRKYARFRPEVVLGLVRLNVRVSFAQLVSVYPGVTYHHLNDMIDRGELVRTGAGRKHRYSVPDSGKP